MSVYLFKGIEVILLLLCRFVVFIEINGICEPLAIEDMGSGIGRKIVAFMVGMSSLFTLTPI